MYAYAYAYASNPHPPRAARKMQFFLPRRECIFVDHKRSNSGQAGADDWFLGNFCGAERSPRGARSRSATDDHGFRGELMDRGRY